MSNTEMFTTRRSRTFNIQLRSREHGYAVPALQHVRGRIQKILERGLVLPAYDYVLKCSHSFNLLDARNAISVTERTGYIGRVRALASACCQAYLEQREKMGHPLMGKFDKFEKAEGGTR